jgi:hypothetical protein
LEVTVEEIGGLLSDIDLSSGAKRRKRYRRAGM